MKVVAFNGSPHKEGNTAILLQTVPGEVTQDQEGMRTMPALGRNMAWLLQKLHG